MPNKHNADHRHHIPKTQFKVQNWAEYEAGLLRRGSLTLWIEDAVLDQRQTVGPRGQARYLDIAIETCLMLRVAFKIPLRQTEGLMDSVLTWMNLTITAADHTTVSRRVVGLTVTKSTSAAKGPLHVLIDSPGLPVGVARSDWLWPARSGRNDNGSLSIIGPPLRARGFEAQQTETTIGVAVLNRMLAAGRPNSVCSQKVPA
jgi:hypothetical protein